MKNTLLFILLSITTSLYCQDKKLSGVYTEYKRTLWNDDDGSKYTIDGKPFEPKLQFEFNADSNTVIFKNPQNKPSKQYFVMNGDTLIIKLPVGRGEKRDTIYNKYVIMENNKELVLRDYKFGLTKEFYIKKYYFKKGEANLSDLKKDEPREIFTMVEEMPSYPKGIEEMRKFISKEVSKSKLKGTERVFLKLLINPEGKIIDVEILATPKVEYAAEAINIT